MDVTIHIFGIGGIVLFSILTGYFIGNREQKTIQREGAEQAVGLQEGLPEERTHRSEKHRGNNEHGIFFGKSIASPASGEVCFFCESGRKGAVIEPEQGTVYAPVSGKISKMYPMGNAFILRSDEQCEPKELLIQVGRNAPDELCSMYFRPHIVQNEIVNKGKLLLTFDKERLQAAGEDASVLVGLETGIDTQDVRVTQNTRVKVGEELMWVREG